MNVTSYKGVICQSRSCNMALGKFAGRQERRGKLEFWSELFIMYTVFLKYGLYFSQPDFNISEERFDMWATAWIDGWVGYSAIVL